MAKPKVFVIMPFNDSFFEVYEMLRREFEAEYDFSNAAEEGNQQNILKDIVQPIFEADIVIADLTGLNSNVLYELGVAHTFNKKTIVITQDDLMLLPFDLKQYRAKDYSTHFKKFAELLVYLNTNLAGAISGDIIFSNPVKDFLALSGNKNVAWFTNEKIAIDMDDSEKGFIDFVADIEEDESELTETVNTLITEMNVMSNGINSVTDSIQNAQTTGGSGTASFVKKEARKAASHMDVFGGKLKNCNTQLVETWNRIEKNTLGLLESPYTPQEDNRDGLISFLRSLKNLQDTIIASNESVKGMKTSSLNNIGIQRTLNQSIRFLDEDLKTYLEIMENIAGSIDKIIRKSKFIVGEIDFIEVEVQDETELVSNTNEWSGIQ